MECKVESKTESRMESDVKQYALSLGADVCGVANIDRFWQTPEGFAPKDIWSKCKSVLVFGIALPKGITEVDPRIIYGHFNYDVCHEVDRIAHKLAKHMESEYGAHAVPIPSDGPYEYWEEDNMVGKGLLSMKHAAVLAGLGALGKSTLLINKKYGTLLTLGAVLTDLDLESDELCESLCEEGCSKCIDSCPSAAIVEGTVIQKRCRLHAYGRTKRGFDTVNCNTCRVVCPRRFGV